MALKVYYFRKERNCQMTVGPRCGLPGVEPGTAPTVQHSRDLGREIFPAPQGSCEFISRLDGE